MIFVMDLGSPRANLITSERYRKYSIPTKHQIIHRYSWNTNQCIIISAPAKLRNIVLFATSKSRLRCIFESSISKILSTLDEYEQDTAQNRYPTQLDAIFCKTIFKKQLFKPVKKNSNSNSNNNWHKSNNTWLGTSREIWKGSITNFSVEIRNSYWD